MPPLPVSEIKSTKVLSQCSSAMVSVSAVILLILAMVLGCTPANL